MRAAAPYCPGMRRLAVIVTLSVSLLALSALSATADTPPPADPQAVAQESLALYFKLINQGEGSAFCAEAVTAAFVANAGGPASCASGIDDYVKTSKQQAWAGAVEDMHYLFYQVQDGVDSHCRAKAPCSPRLFARWANAEAQGEIRWISSSDPRQAIERSSKPIAVVDPRRSTRKAITIYYQASDNRVLRARWATSWGSWRGSVSNTGLGEPFIARVQVLSATVQPDGSILAQTSFRTGGSDQIKDFTLRLEDGSWRSDD